MQLPKNVPNNLPVQLSSFVGREHEIAEVARSLGTTRLLTLTGSGGTGKTRLALEVAAALADQYPDGVWFVALASVADGGLVPQTVASTLGVSEQPGRPISATLTDHLRGKYLLLLLDNCEHLIEACARIADDSLRAAPHIKILATSREALRITGELAWRVPSLPTPNPAAVTQIPLAQLEQYAAVRLFVERAAFALSTFVLTGTNAPAVAQICYRLDGIPLAIELAAARVTALRVEQIAARLDDRFHLLTLGSRTALPRQRTLRGAIDWSYGLLSEPERILLRRLSVFAGGWTPEAAEAVCADAGPDGIAAGDVLDLLAHLVDKSLVLSDEQTPEARHRMLETIRQYAGEKLLESGEGDAVRDRHLHFFADFAGDAEVNLNGADQKLWLERLEAEHDNLRAAIEWTPQSPDRALRLRLPAALYMFWHIHGYQSEGLAALRQALAHTSNQPWSEPVALARVDALFTAIVLLWAQDKIIETRPYVEEMLVLDERLGDNPYRGRTYHALGIVALNEGDFAAARDWLLKSIAAAQGPADAEWLSASLFNLGDEAYFQSDYSEAQRWYTESVAHTRQRADKNILAYPLRRLGYIAIQQGELDKAELLIGESLSNNLAVSEMGGAIGCLAGLAAICLARAQPVRAVMLCGCVGALLEASHKNLLPIDKKDYERSLAAARAQLGEPEFAAAWEAGSALTLEQAVALTDRTLAGAPEASTSTTPQQGYPAGLTAREVEVLRLLAQGLTDAQIAETLVISPRTVNAHLRAIYGKLDVTTRTAAARHAAEFKLQ